VASPLEKCNWAIVEATTNFACLWSFAWFDECVLGGKVEQQLFKPTGDLEIIPSRTSGRNDFDFFIGKNFYARDVFQGKDIIVLYHWDRTTPDRPLWSQAFSADNGNTWEWNWYMSFYKQT